MVQGLRALDAVGEDLGSILYTHMVAHHLQLQFQEESDPLFRPPQGPGTHEANRNTSRKNIHTQTHTKRN